MTEEEKETTVRTRGPSPDKTARTRSQIIQAAMEEFLENGYADATMSGIATRAGLAKGTTYRYFPTKDALFAGIVSEIVSQPLFEAHLAPIGPDESVGQYCLRTLLPAMHMIEEQGRAEVARLALTEGRAFPHLIEVYRTEVYQPFLASLRELIRIAAQRGELKCMALLDHPHLLAAPLWMGIVHNGLLGNGGSRGMEDRIDTAAMFKAQVEMVFTTGAGSDA